MTLLLVIGYLIKKVYIYIYIYMFATEIVFLRKVIYPNVINGRIRQKEEQKEKQKHSFINTFLLHQFYSLKTFLASYTLWSRSDRRIFLLSVSIHRYQPKPKHLYSNTISEKGV